MTSGARPRGGVRRYTPLFVVLGMTLVGSLFLRVGGGDARAVTSKLPVSTPTLPMPVPFSPPVDLVFLHHSVGAQLLSEPGADDPARGTHPNGGGLRRALEANGYRVHEATYGSRLGEHTDLFDWRDKFEKHMEDVLRIDQQDAVLPAGRKNAVVLFKSCFPNNEFVDAGTASGSRAGPELTEANAKEALTALLPAFQKRPEVLFVYLTAPPLAAIARDERLIKILARRVLGRPSARERLRRAGEIARHFNAWVVAPDGWLAPYPLRNVVVFDLYSILTDGSESGLSAFGSEGGTDSHPSSEGNRLATARLVPFLNAAVVKAGLSASEPALPVPVPTASGSP